MESWGVEGIRPWGLRAGHWPLFTTTAHFQGNFLVKCHFLLYFHSFAFTRNLCHGLERTSIFRQGSPLKHNRCWERCETGQKRKGGPSLVFLWLRLCTPYAGAQVWSLVKELRSHVLHGLKKKKKKRKRRGGAVDKKLPANAGDTGWLSGLGRFHMPRGSQAHAQPLSLCCSAHELYFLKPGRPEPILCNKRNHHKEKLLYLNEEYPPLAITREEPVQSNKHPVQQK